MEALIKVRGVRKAYLHRSTGKELIALRDVDVDIMPNEFVCLLGPSGCGKTTLLKIMDGMIEAERGTVTLGDRPLREALGDIGFVFQDVGLLAWRTVIANVGLGLEARGMAKEEREKRAMEYVKLVGLEDFATYHPYQLSGGMQQRVGLARALAVRPKVLLMDEPFGAVDALTRRGLQIALARIWEQNRVTVVFVTHDVDEALFLADRIIMMNTAKVVKSVVIDLPRPRWDHDNRTDPHYVALRTGLIRTLDAAAGAMAGGAW
jgi:NitT/TauT family transport system ATP-binding protein